MYSTPDSRKTWNNDSGKFQIVETAWRKSTEIVVNIGSFDLRSEKEWEDKIHHVPNLDLQINQSVNVNG